MMGNKRALLIHASIYGGQGEAPKKISARGGWRRSANLERWLPSGRQEGRYHRTKTYALRPFICTTNILENPSKRIIRNPPFFAFFASTARSVVLTSIKTIFPGRILVIHFQGLAFIEQSLYLPYWSSAQFCERDFPLRSLKKLGILLLFICGTLTQAGEGPLALATTRLVVKGRAASVLSVFSV